TTPQRPKVATPSITFAAGYTPKPRARSTLASACTTGRTRTGSTHAAELNAAVPPNHPRAGPSSGPPLQLHLQEGVNDAKRGDTTRVGKSTRASNARHD